MAQSFEKASQAAINKWQHWGDPASISLQNDGTDDYIEVEQGNSSVPPAAFFSFSDVDGLLSDTLGDAEVFLELSFLGITFAEFSRGHVGFSTLSDTFLAITSSLRPNSNGEIDLNEFDLQADTRTVLASDQITALQNADAVKIRMRIRRVGTSYKMVVWRKSDTEPSTWQIELTVSDTPPAAGVLVAKDLPHGIYQWGLGTNGDSAPTGPVSAVATPTNLGVTNLTDTSARLTWDQG